MSGLPWFPWHTLIKDEASLLKETVRRRILCLAKGTKAPTFRGTSDRDGAVVFNCTDRETEEWLRSLTSELKINGIELRALRVDELPRRHRIVVHVEDPTIPVKEALELLDRQNVGIQSPDWVIAKGSESRDATSTHFAALIGDGALRALRALNFKPYCGLGQATIRLPAGESSKEGAKEKPPGPSA